MPCLQLSPLLTNVVAAHVIADAKGGPHGEDKKETWNFIPTCVTCNDASNMGTKNAIDWFYEVCKSNHNFKPLFEMLYRLWRARCENIPRSRDSSRKNCISVVNGYESSATSTRPHCQRGWPRGCVMQLISS